MKSGHAAGRALALVVAASLACPAAAGEPDGALKRSDFPKDFLWGVATAAYQIEGDNKNADLWDWERRRGWQESGKATDSLEKVEDDVRALRELGVNSYRFSMEWSRIVPQPGEVDEQAVAYYQKLLALLRAAGIAPLVTIHHFTNPRWFWERHPRGWADPSAVDDYEAFVRVLAARFGGQVDYWVTFNEPVGYLLNGYMSGNMPPGKKLSGLGLPPDLQPAIRNIALAHRRAYRLLHEADPRPALRVGLVQNPSAVDPRTDTPRDRAAAERWEHFFTWNLLDAAANGSFDETLRGGARVALDEGGRGLDFVGLNYYTRVFVRDFPSLGPVRALPFTPELRGTKAGRLLYRLAGGATGPGPQEASGHEVYAEGLRRVVDEAWGRYGLPVMVTENGLDDPDDAMRAAFIAAHLRALKDAVADGAHVLGYVHWSLMDNYEWGSFKPKLGLYKVDREHDYQRIPTASARRLAAFLRGEELPALPRPQDAAVPRAGRLTVRSEAITGLRLEAACASKQSRTEALIAGVVALEPALSGRLRAVSSPVRGGCETTFETSDDRTTLRLMRAAGSPLDRPRSIVRVQGNVVYEDVDWRGGRAQWIVVERQ